MSRDLIAEYRAALEKLDSAKQDLKKAQKRREEALEAVQLAYDRIPGSEQSGLPAPPSTTSPSDENRMGTDPSVFRS